MDGAIAGNTPILTAAELGASRIIVLQTGYACSLEGPPKGAVARGMHALTLLIANQMERDLRLLEGKVDVHVAPHLCPLDVSPFNFDRSGELIERAAQVTRAWLDQGGLGVRAAVDVFDHKHDEMRANMPALRGYDVVSYFQGDGKPLVGTTDYTARHEDRLYRFATQQNRDEFAKSPTRFLPQYGGLCAYAMARGKQIAGDADVYDIVDGRLYLNLNRDIQEKWARERASNIARADERWRALA